MGGVYKRLTNKQIASAKYLLSLGISQRKVATQLQTSPYLIKRVMTEEGFIIPPLPTAEENYRNRIELARMYAQDGASITELRAVGLRYETALRIYREENHIQSRHRYTAEEVTYIRNLIENEGCSKMYVAKLLEAPVSSISKLCKRHKIGVENEI